MYVAFRLLERVVNAQKLIGDQSECSIDILVLGFEMLSISSSHSHTDFDRFPNTFAIRFVYLDDSCITYAMRSNI